MKWKNNHIVLFPCLALILSGAGCQSASPGAKHPQQKHWAEVNNPALGLLYVDKAEPGQVMQVTDSANTRFVAYKVGWRDEISSADNKYKQEKGKYLQYDMPHDWALKMQNDSFAVVFSQPVVKTVLQEDEAILVFEIPAGANPDTLIYRDSFGGWGTQKIILNSH